MFTFFRNRRRRRLIETSLVPAALWEPAVRKLPVLRGLDTGGLERLRELATIFIAEKDFMPVRGAVLTDALKVLIAAQACLPVLKLGIGMYDGWRTIIITPREYRVENREVDEGGVVHEYEDEAAGEVLEAGSVVLSLADVRDSGGGYNVVIHEMAHKLDMSSGAMDGMPHLGGRADRADWSASFGEAFGKLRAAVEGSGRKGRGRKGSGSGGPDDRSAARGLRLIDPYAAEDPGEFFAVICEYFFERPRVLLRVFPDVYRLLAAYFVQDPAGRVE